MINQSLQAELQNFMLSADDFLSSKYILADKKISSFLKTMAVSSQICALLQLCLKDFDYNNAKKAYTTATYFGDDAHKEIILPDDRNKVIAFVFLTLVGLDDKSIDLPTFLQTYFYEDGSFYESYNSFLQNFIYPFVDAVKSILTKVLDGKNLSPAEELQAEKFNEIENSFEINDVIENKTALNSLLSLLNEDKNNVLDNDAIDKKRKGEILIVIDYFITALQNDNRDFVKYAYVSYKFMAITNRKHNLNLFKVTTIMEKENII